MTSATPDARLADLAADLCGAAPEPFGQYILAADDPRAELARAVERDVFLEVFGNTSELLEREYAPYEAATVFGVVVDHRHRRPIAANRFIVDSPVGHKSLVDIGAPPWSEDPDQVLARSGLRVDRARTLDVATAAICADYRGARSRGLAGLALAQITTRLSALLGFEWLVMIIDVGALAGYQRLLRDVMAVYDGVEPCSYLDSPLSVPCYSDVRDWQARVQVADRELYDLMVGGHGLEAAIAPFDVDAARAAFARAGYRQVS